MFESIKKTILEITKELESKKTEERINQRIAKFGKMGSFKE